MPEPGDLQQLIDGNAPLPIVNANTTVIQALLPTSAEKAYLDARPWVQVCGCVGLPASGAYLLYMAAAVPFTLPVGLAGTQLVAQTAAAADATFTLYKTGTSIGTITIAPGGALTVVFAATVSFVAGDILEVVAPSPADEAMANPWMTLLGVCN